MARRVTSAAAEGPSLAAVALGALLLRLVLFLAPGLEGISRALERRPELSTPVSSFMAIKEVLHLEQLHDASGGLLPKPYASGTLHISPIMLLLARPWHRALAASPELLHVASALLWSVVDVLTGLLLAGAFTRKRTLAKSTTWTAYRTASSRGPSEYIDSIVYAGAMFASPGGVAACYLFNPLTIASCLARSTGPFNALAVILAADAGLAASPLALGIALATATLLSLYPLLLSPALVLLCATASAEIGRKRRRENRNTWSRTTAVLSVLFFAAALAGGVYASFLVAGRDWSFLKRAYGTILLVPDLTPNIGLWWYFFIEIFDHFRDFFLLAFNVHAASYSLPLTIKYSQDPLFAVTALCGLTAVLKSYPTLSDASLFLALISLHTEIIPYLRHPFVTALLYTISTLLMPALHHVWLNAGSGNANFFYASTLVWALGSGAAVLDTMWAWGRWRWEADRPAAAFLDEGKKGAGDGATRRVVQV